MLKSISAKFSASLVTVIMLGTLMGVLGIYNSHSIMEANAQNEFTHVVIESVGGVRENLFNIETGERGFLLRGDESYLQPYQDGKVQVQAYLEKAEKLTGHNPLVTAKLKEFSAEYGRWMSEVIEPMIAVKRQQIAGTITQAQFDAELKSRPSKPKMDAMRAVLADVEKEEVRLLGLRKEAAQSTYEQSIWIAAGITIFALVVGLGLNFVIARFFKHKVGIASGVLQALAEGKLNSRFQIQGDDEIDRLLADLSKAQNNLQNLIGEIRSSAVDITGSSNEVLGASDEMARAATEQADATASMAAAVEELTVSIGQITENSGEASQTALQAKRSADGGMQTLGQVVNNIRQIANSVQTSAQAVRSMEQQSSEISEIVSTITEIAEKTNLLALNAAIEAARAGESGRGFAVVADEVRKLAEQTKGSTDRISGMVNQIQSITRDASNSMESSVELVEQGIAQADTVSSAIAQIKSDADRVSDAIAAISVSMKEQSNVSVEISRNVERVAQMTEENTAAISLNKDRSSRISQLAGELQRSVGQFTV
ncbi:methyl-accepting chemotaxis protein [Limnobacter humi]|uniref:Methyl-accepting chemotaxis protein n=1 Tax=Limnobacter humi TaxID=1778671 RepID=A0ABT1WHC0_9BURK|nr:methyl-accepting chemotaxis protein [Limnobacter humi]MCQ8896929.1 methyl-accepting chemotaxis protein [Limnobacter humi]